MQEHMATEIALQTYKDTGDADLAMSLFQTYGGAA